MNSVFVTRNIQYHCLRRKIEFETKTVKTSTYGSETVRFRASKAWELVPDERKVSTIFSEFKTKIKIGKLQVVLETYVPNLGLIFTYIFLYIICWF